MTDHLALADEAAAALTKACEPYYGYPEMISRLEQAVRVLVLQRKGFLDLGNEACKERDEARADARLQRDFRLAAEDKCERLGADLAIQEPCITALRIQWEEKCAEVDRLTKENADIRATLEGTKVLLQECIRSGDEQKAEVERLRRVLREIGMWGFSRPMEMGDGDDGDGHFKRIALQIVALAGRNMKPSQPPEGDQPGQALEADPRPRAEDEDSVG